MLKKCQCGIYVIGTTDKCMKCLAIQKEKDEESISGVTCPNCDSKNVVGYAYLCGYGNVNMKTGHIEERPDDLDYDIDDIDEFTCDNCGYEWRKEEL